MIAHGMDPLYAVPLANRSDSGNSCSSSNSSESISSSSSAVGTDTSNKTPVATIVDGNDGDQGGFVDDCNDATDDVILDCAAGTLCNAPSGANLAESPHSCWGCNKKIHSSVLCGDSILNLLSNHPSFIGTLLNNGRIIEQDDNNKTRALCFTCIVPLSGFPIAARTLKARKASMLAPRPPARLQLLGQLNCDWVSHCCVRKTETPGSCT